MKEALKLALEALENIGMVNYDWATKASQAMTAIKAALAQQDGQSNFCTQCEAFARELKAVKQALAAQPAQEPVTWGVDWGKSGDRPCAVIVRRLSAACNEVLAVEFAPYTYNEVKEKQNERSI